MPKGYYKSKLTGGTSDALDSIDGAGLNDLDYAICVVSGEVYHYVLDDDLGGADDSPDIIVPDSNAGNKRWVLQKLAGTTANLSDLSAGYLPYHTASGLADSPIQTDGSKVGIGPASPFRKLQVKRTGDTRIAIVQTGTSDTALEFSEDTPHTGKTWAIGMDYSNSQSLAIAYDATGEPSLTGNNLVTISTTGNLGLNTTTFGNNAANVFGIGNGTAPTSSPADMVHMWAEDVSSSSELKVRDEAGNVTTLSPHNFSLFEPSEDYYFPWSYHSRNPLLGREINVDMYGAISDLEKLTKKKYIYTRDLPPEDALEETEETVEIQDGHEIVTRYQLDGGKVMKVERAKPKVKKVPTGNVAYKLREGVRFCEKTGKFFRKPTLEEIEYEPYQPKQLPAWIQKRISTQKKETN